MNFQSQHLIKLKVDELTGFRRTRLWLLLGVSILSIAIYSMKLSTYFSEIIYPFFQKVCSNIAVGSQPFIDIPTVDCDEEPTDAKKLCKFWNLSKSLELKSKVSDLSNSNKFFLVKLLPILNSKSIEGSGEFKLPLNLDYKYRLDKADKTTSTSNGDLSLKVSCNTEQECESFNIIYDPAITQQLSASFQISIRLDNWNRKIIKGFKVFVSNRSQILISST